jgi:hypothetical protein
VYSYARSSGKYDDSTCSFLILAAAKYQYHQAKSFQISPKRVVVNPPMKDEKFGVFHSKLMLLFHQSSLRVVISSANFVSEY